MVFRRKLKNKTKQTTKEVKQNKTQLPLLANHEKKNISRLSEGSNLRFEICTSEVCWLYVDNSLLVFLGKQLVIKCAQGRLRLEPERVLKGPRGLSVLLKIYLYIYIYLSTYLPIYSVEYLLSACCMLSLCLALRRGKTDMVSIFSSCGDRPKSKNPDH